MQYTFVAWYWLSVTKILLYLLFENAYWFLNKSASKFRKSCADCSTFNAWEVEVAQQDYLIIHVTVIFQYAPKPANNSRIDNYILIGIHYVFTNGYVICIQTVKTTATRRIFFQETSVSWQHESLFETTPEPLGPS